MQCIPLSTFWDERVSGNCAVDNNKLKYAVLTSHLLLDLLILIMPLSEISKLRLESWSKVGMMVILMFGVL